MSLNEQVDIVYTDFSKCFDRIDHPTLLCKLESVGIRGNLYRWFKSYVENRCQTVVLNGYTSEAIFISSGVPQGSLLGPLLFNVFINDISSVIHYSKILLYADDVKIMKRIDTIDDACLLQEDLYRFWDYCVRNKLDLNISKCHVCSFTRKPRPVLFQYKFLDTIISRVCCVRDLGVKFDAKLLFKDHIDEIMNKSNKALGFILRTSSELKDIKTMKILYCCFVRSHLEYASQVWNPVYAVYINRLENVQKKFLRYLQWRSKTYFPNYLERCKRFHFLSLSERRRIADLVLLFKIFNGMSDAPELLSSFGLRTPSVSLRKFSLLDTPTVSTTYRQNSYVIRSSRTYNTACQEVDIDLFNTSIVKLKRIMSKCFFSCNGQ